MKTIRHTPRLIVGLALVLAALVVLAGSAAAAGRSAGMSPEAYQALMLRSQALNQLYGTAATRMTPSELKALYVRSSWLNEHAKTLWPASTPAAAVPTVVTVHEGFDWRDAAIGAGFVAGLVLLGAAGAVTVRRHGGFIRHPH
jgi:hypothetical protein